MSGFPDTLLQRIDFSQPDVYVIFLALLILLPYWWWHEETEVNREFARFFREVAKEADLSQLLQDEPAWKENLKLPQWLDLGLWFVLAWTLLLGLVCGVVYLHGAQDDNFRRVLIVASSEEDKSAIQSSLERLTDTPESSRCTVSCSEKEIEQFLCKPSPEGNQLFLHWPIDADARVKEAATMIRSSGRMLNLQWGAGLQDAQDVNAERLPHKGRGAFRFADLVLERPQGIIFHERIAVVLSRKLGSKTLSRVSACLDAGDQRRGAQQVIGICYIGLVVLLVCMVKFKKTSAFKKMLLFSQRAAERKQNALPRPSTSEVAYSPPIAHSPAASLGSPTKAKKAKGPLKRKK